MLDLSTAAYYVSALPYWSKSWVVCKSPRKTTVLVSS